MNNSQLAHVWAQQNQDSGKANNFYFEGPTLYSYGSHFIAGKIHAVKGKVFAVTNSYRYSNTTARHLSHARSAVRGLMPSFESPDPRDLRCTRNWLDGLPKHDFDRLLKIKRVTSRHDLDAMLNSVTRLENEADEFRKLVGLKPMKRDIKLRAKVALHLLERLKRYKELNTPEVIAKREAEKQKRAENRLAKAINEFRAGKQVFGKIDLPYDLLRIKNGDDIQTSRGASVPIEQARSLYRLVKSGKDIKGIEVGHFTAIKVEMIPGSNDRVVQVGCHKILLSEADRIFNKNALTIAG